MDTAVKSSGGFFVVGLSRMSQRGGILKHGGRCAYKIGKRKSTERDGEEGSGFGEWDVGGR